MISNLSIERIKEMLWEEIFLANFSDAEPQIASERIVDLGVDFTEKRRLCITNVQEALDSLISECRALPNGTVLSPGSSSCKAYRNASENYENLIHTGGLQCVKIKPPIPPALR